MGESVSEPDYDVLILGAGLSGVCAAYYLQDRCPERSFAILEGRTRLGGTWDLFRYPGIRSDSDMYTLGYSFRPWTAPDPIGDGASILAYIAETARHFAIDRHIQYERRAIAARWSSASALWTVDVRNEATQEVQQVTCRFVFACMGYYHYDEGYTPRFVGIERYRHPVVHPQHWTDEIEYSGKRVVVIGSGATAVTLVPALAERAAHVTMLQRSPSYVLSLPEQDHLGQWLRRRLPEGAAASAMRWRSVLLGMLLYEFCQRQPRLAKRWLLAQVRQHLGGAVDVHPHFDPDYGPWDQRVCLVPNADLFRTLREGRASVVTDTIETFTEDGIMLSSGQHLDADLVITATGLRLQFLGGMTVDVDGRRVPPNDLVVYRGTMFSDVPNLAFGAGYTNASWTLKCELSARYVCRVLNHMASHGHVSACPHRVGDTGEDQPLLNLKSGYVLRALKQMPKQGSKKPWRLYQNYVLDQISLGYGKLEDGALTFR